MADEKLDEPKICSGESIGNDQFSPCNEKELLAPARSYDSGYASIDSVPQDLGNDLGNDLSPGLGSRIRRLLDLHRTKAGSPSHQLFPLKAYPPAASGAEGPEGLNEPAIQNYARLDEFSDADLKCFLS